MDKKQMKLGAIVCGVICLICIFIAIERYNTNADNVRAMNAVRKSIQGRRVMNGGNEIPGAAMEALERSTRLGQEMGGGELTPAMPTASKYAIFFAVVFGISGAILFVKSQKEDAPSKEDSTADEMA
jgi:hypothetical protein